MSKKRKAEGFFVNFIHLNNLKDILLFRTIDICLDRCKAFSLLYPHKNS